LLFSILPILTPKTNDMSAEQVEEVVAEVVRQINEIPLANLSKDTFMSKVRNIDLIKRIYVSRRGNKDGKYSFGVIIAPIPDQIPNRNALVLFTTHEVNFINQRN